MIDYQMVENAEDKNKAGKGAGNTEVGGGSCYFYINGQEESH